MEDGEDSVAGPLQRILMKQTTSLQRTLHQIDHLTLIDFTIELIHLPTLSRFDPEIAGDQVKSGLHAAECCIAALLETEVNNKIKAYKGQSLPT